MVSELITDRITSSVVGLESYAADVYVGGDHLTDLDRGLEQIIQWVIKEFGEEQIVKAKDEFYWKMGKVFADDEFYNQRMGYFIDYFVFQRVFETENPSLAGLSPFQAYYELFLEGGNIALKDGRHSIFQVIKIQNDGLVIKDLLLDQKMIVKKRDMESFHGIGKKDIFQGFVYCGDNLCLLSRGLIFHPPEASSLIKKQIKKSRKSKELDEISLLSKYARQQMRHMRHRHVNPRTIYINDPS